MIPAVRCVGGFGPPHSAPRLPNKGLKAGFSIVGACLRVVINRYCARSTAVLFRSRVAGTRSAVLPAYTMQVRYKYCTVLLVS